MLKSILSGLLALALGFVVQVVQAGAMPAALSAPTQPVVLTVTGAIAVTNAPGAAQFDLAMLEAMGAETIRTTTIWTDGVQEFTGLPLHRLLEHLGVKTGRLEARAINDYAAEVPMADAVPGGAMIAWLRNGAPMPVRDKGPLWIIYPYDASPAFRTESHYSRSVWQLERIDVRP
ncbi:MAG: molybdopterin-dependent oxidoreductase [Gemmobacter sp.]|nr:molybdopterin-dependent oxidoreductase [Gemmobacter sp.]